ncbi:type II toxin-antitoxin system VapC family toxin [Methylobacter sp.]|uniref:type II toxin-antitoxin system VapC family toxin n=1 Tax=Methylobacter sp. TaxID=2051955 RepID=UPI002FDD8372
MGSQLVILLDTHALVWMDQDNAALGKTARSIAQAAWESWQLAVSAISFWECEMLHRAGRLVLPQSPSRWRDELLATGLIEYPIDGEIGIFAVALEGLHKDPADRFIAATAILKNATLLTADAKLLQWQHSLKRHDAAQ